MGWTFAYDTNYTKDKLVADLRKPERFGPDTTLLQSSIRGNNHWYLARNNIKGITWIGLDLLQGGGRTQGWGHKDMDETCGPCQLDCPISYLDKASEPVGYATEWRQQVREFHAKRSTRPIPTAGQVVTFGGHDYTLIRSAGPHKGWVVDNTAGSRYRLTAKQLANATIKEAA